MRRAQFIHVFMMKFRSTFFLFSGLNNQTTVVDLLNLNNAKGTETDQKTHIYSRFVCLIMMMMNKVSS